jgi:hypothetical protein
MSVIKITNNQILGISQTLQTVNIEEINTKTAYWISRNIRISSIVGNEFEKLQADIRNDKWFKELQIDIGAIGQEKAELKWKEQLETSNNELKDYLSKETDIEFYKVSIDDLNIPSKIIPLVMDLISE